MHENSFESATSEIDREAGERRTAIHRCHHTAGLLAKASPGTRICSVLKPQRPEDLCSREERAAETLLLRGGRGQRDRAAGDGSGG
jgi:hypothetical protein